MSFSQSCINCGLGKRLPEPIPTSHELLEQSRLHEKRVEMLEALYLKPKEEDTPSDDIRRSPSRHVTPQPGKRTSPWRFKSSGTSPPLSAVAVPVEIKSSPPPSSTTMLPPPVKVLMRHGTEDLVRHHKQLAPGSRPVKDEHHLRQAVVVEADARKDSEKRCQVLEERLGASRKRVMELTSEVESGIIRTRELQEDLARSEAQATANRNATDLVKSFEDRLTTSRQRVAELTNSLDLSERKNSGYEVRLQQALENQNTNNADQENQNALLGERLTSTRQRVAELSSELQSKETALTEAEEKAEKLETANQELTNALNKNKNTHAKHKIETDRLEAKVRSLGLEAVGMRSEISTRDETISALEKKLTEVRMREATPSPPPESPPRVSPPHEQEVPIISVMDSPEYISLLDKLQSLQTDLDNCKSDLTTAQGESQQLKNDLQNSDSSFKSCEAELFNLQQQLLQQEQKSDRGGLELEESDDVYSTCMSQLLLRSNVSQMNQLEESAVINKRQLFNDATECAAALCDSFSYSMNKSLLRDIKELQHSEDLLRQNIKNTAREQLQLLVDVSGRLMKQSPEPIDISQIRGIWRTTEGDIVTIRGTDVIFEQSPEHVCTLKKTGDDQFEIVELNATAIYEPEHDIIKWSDSDVWTRCPLGKPVVGSNFLVDQDTELSNRIGIVMSEADEFCSLVIQGAMLVTPTALLQLLGQSKQLEQSLNTSQNTVQELSVSLREEEDKRRSAESTIQLLGKTTESTTADDVVKREVQIAELNRQLAELQTVKEGLQHQLKKSLERAAEQEAANNQLTSEVTRLRILVTDSTDALHATTERPFTATSLFRSPVSTMSSSSRKEYNEKVWHCSVF